VAPSRCTAKDLRRLVQLPLDLPARGGFHLVGVVRVRLV